VVNLFSKQLVCYGVALTLASSLLTGCGGGNQSVPKVAANTPAAPNSSVRKAKSCDPISGEGCVPPAPTIPDTTNPQWIDAGGLPCNPETAPPGTCNQNPAWVPTYTQDQIAGGPGAGSNGQLSQPQCTDLFASRSLWHGCFNVVGIYFN